MRVLAILFFVKGFFYVAFPVWTTMINRLEFYMAPPALGTLAYGFFLVMFGVGAFFVARAWFLSTVSRGLLASDLYVSAVAFLLWSLPALVSFGNANTYFTTAPESLCPYAYSYLMTGILFSIIGAINISSMVYMGWLRFSRKTRISDIM